MPLPCSLVVKNGSKMRALRRLVHADAGVADRQHDVRPGRHAEIVTGVGRRRGRRSPVSIVSLPPSGIASRALTTRFMITCSICPGSALILPSDGAAGPSEARCLRRSRGAACLSIFAMISLRSTTAGASTCCG